MNKQEREWLEKLSRAPCLIGDHNCGGPLETHHLTDGGRRIRTEESPEGHLFSIKLCFNHHQAQSPLPVGEAYHKGKKLFCRKYGDNDELLAKQKERLNGYNPLY